VPEVTVRYDGYEVSVEVHVDFTRMLAVARAAIPASELVAIAVELLTQGSPVDETFIDRSILS
jgi:hypothetical protein